MTWSLLVRCFLVPLLPVSVLAAQPPASIAAAPGSIGYCYNGFNHGVPPPLNGVVNLNGYGYAVCSIAVSGATVVNQLDGSILSVSGDNNRIFSGYVRNPSRQFHGRYEIKGSGNYLFLGAASGNIDITGSGNVFNVWDTFATEHGSGGNTWYVRGNGGDWIWNNDVGRAQRFLDKVDLSHVLDLLGCKPDRSAGCEEQVLTLSDAGGHHELRQVGRILPGNGPILYFFDCDPANNVALSAFLRNTVARATPNFPDPPPKESVPDWPAGIARDSMRVIWLGPLTLMAGPRKGGLAWLSTAPIIYDPWSYANANSKVTVTLSLERETWSGGRSSVTKTDTQAVVNEWIVSQRVKIRPGASSDMIVVEATNLASPPYSVTYKKPVAISWPGACF